MCSTSAAVRAAALTVTVVVVVATFRAVVVAEAFALQTGAVEYASAKVTTHDVGEPLPVVTLMNESPPATAGEVPQEPPMVGVEPLPR